MDDGSRDGASSVVIQYVQKYYTSDEYLNYAFDPSLSTNFIRLKANQGKGAAIRAYSNSHYLLMVDADGATDINNHE